MAIGFILGMCVMSAGAIAAVNLSDTHHWKLTAFCLGPLCWIYLVIGYPIVQTIRKVKLWYFRHNFIRCRFYIKDGHSEDTWYIHKDVVELFYHKGENHDERCITEEADCMSAKSIPYKWSKCISKHGWMYSADRHDQWEIKAALSTIRPYTDLYRKIEQGA